MDAASITRSDIDDALRPVRKEYGRAKLNNSVPRAVLYLTDFQGKTVARCLLSSVASILDLLSGTNGRGALSVSFNMQL